MRTKRIDYIESYIEQEKSVTLDHLCDKFQVSKNTIRRDIDELVKRGTVRKVYGGVTASPPASDTGLLPYEQRNTCFQTEKTAICQKAASYVQAGDIIYIDTGTTCFHMVDFLANTPCTIITNSLQICMKAVPYEKLQVICLPGSLKRETLSFVGSEILEYLQIFNISKAFMACTGVTLENGLTNASMEEYRIKQAVIQNSFQHYLLTDRSKFGKFSLMTYCALCDIQYIITDRLPNSEFITYCQEHQIQLETAELNVNS